ncbi:MAG TPA: SDR family NAD(P)-dependent oxidoreductase [Candidatus Angelobacter sp.]|nr:SDR family NAD(P)-dependent oxidoreductase [Candidatus Angelobacter sp.]
MDISSNTVLITGGASGIGLAIAERFLGAGSQVVICGRREDKLREAKSKHPGLHTHVADVASEADRVALFQWAAREFPKLNVLVNNAGIQRRFQLAPGIQTASDWTEIQSEIAINFEAPIHLSGLFIPHLLQQERPVIMNVTSGLAFVPMALAPVYSATKAALHSYTLSLRHHLTKAAITVIEVIPPAVNTDLGGAGLHTFGVPLDEFADAVFERLRKGELQIAYGFAEQASRASREELDATFARLNQA